MPPPQTVKIFCSYAHKDEPLREALDPHFALLRRQGVATFWSDREIYAGSDWASQIDHNLRAANVILLLLSAHFIDSNYCFDVELRHAVERNLRGEAVVIPVVLQPCKWDRVTVPCEGGEFELGKVQALPHGALPVTKWRNRQEAFDNIADGVSKVVEQLASGAVRWGDKTVTLPTPPTPAPPVPELLPYLCNRATQETLLRRAVHDWRARGSAKRPLVCVVHGGDDEALDMFKRRLHEVTLPALLSARADGDSEPLYDSALGRIDDLFVPLPPSFIEPELPFDFLQAEVGVPVADNMYASPKTVADALSSKDVPTLFHSHLASCDWGGDGERIVDAFLNFWADLPNVKAGRVLSFLFFKYSVGAGGSARLAELNARAEEFFNALGPRLAVLNARAADIGKGAHVLVLPRLPAVGQSDAETWINSREHFRNLCRNHPFSFCNVTRGVEEIERIYKDDPLMRIPLERLAPQLHAVITNHRCGAAA
ncbi:MAG: hypothetical protein QOH49_2706 [Acidobacteriota bacterium]|jgi:hypothetical protein|nr:hypothetical protein [Acidobacteriota bacterium]